MMPCHNRRWNGHILLGYDLKNKEVYIVIEVLMR